MKFEPDTGIQVHERGVIAQLCSLFRSHEQGLPEWFKNASSAYARSNMPSENRVLTLFTGTDPEGSPYVALLDHAGMTVKDLEGKFANWGDPEAHLAEEEVEEVVEGGHGNGGKCYMTQMFSEHSYLHTCLEGRGSRYGFIGDDPRPGYFPSRSEGRGFPVQRAVDELKRALLNLGINFAGLPELVRTTAAMRGGFTLVVGVGAKHLHDKAAVEALAEEVFHHPQMSLTVESTRIYWVHDGKPVQKYCPVVLPDIPPHEYAPDPRIIEIPQELTDPRTKQSIRTIDEGEVQGQLIIRSSRVAMTRKLKPRHHIKFISRSRPVAFLRMENISRSTWVDRMYGDCILEKLADYETPDRSALADAPLTRALEEWIRAQVADYEKEFLKKQRLSASQEQRAKVQALNDRLDEWKNEFLDDRQFGASSEGEGPGGKKRRPRRRPLPQTVPAEAVLHSEYSKAGVGVWLRLRLEFVDTEGATVASPPYQWYSSDWAVATVDDNRVVTHSPGEVEIWAETLDGALRSNPVPITVVDAVASRIEDTEIEVPAGSLRTASAVVEDREGVVHRDIYMTWLQDDSSIVEVTKTGKIIGRKQGETNVYAVDERTVNTARPVLVKVTPKDTGSGSDPGVSYPKILLSEIDRDPLNPEGESVRLSPDDGPVHQPTPQHVEHNIWWINLQCPLAKLYFEEFGPDSREWRSYHVERYVEALAKIKLNYDFQIADAPLTFDEVERRWREVASEVQSKAIQDLKPLLEGSDDW